jgi:hypothetical protein
LIVASVIAAPGLVSDSTATVIASIKLMMMWDTSHSVRSLITCFKLDVVMNWQYYRSLSYHGPCSCTW